MQLLFPTLFNFAYLDTMMMDTDLSQSDTSSVVQTWMMVLCVALSYLVFAPLAFAQAEREAVDGEINIKLTEAAKMQLTEDGVLPRVISKDAGLSSLNKLAQRFSVERMERMVRPSGKHEDRVARAGLDQWYTVEYSAGVSTDQVVSAYSNLAEVEHAEKNFILEATAPVKAEKKASFQDDPGGDEERRAEREARSNFYADAIPNDPEYGTQWHYDNTADNVGTPDADINLPEAHDIETGNPDVIVSIIDNKIDRDHPEFEGMYWINEEEDINNNGQFDPQPASQGGDLNGVDDDNNGFTDDVIGYNIVDDEPDPNTEVADHGSHTAGTVAAKNGNGTFGAGVAGGDGSPDSGVRLMVTPFLADPPEGGGSISDAVEAITYAVNNGAVISNNSWGAGGTTPQALRDAIDNFVNNAGGPDAPLDGGIFVNSAGNSDVPASGFLPAEYGPVFTVSATEATDTKASYSNFGSSVDVAAPGGQFGEDGVWSAVNGGFGSLSGTSMSAPHASSVAALVASEDLDQTLDARAVEQILIDTGKDISGNQQERMGPRIDAQAALAVVSGDDTAPATIDDLAASVVSSGEPGAAAGLTWTAPGNDGTVGTADEYDIRFSTDGPIDDSTAFANAEQVEDEPAPDTAGTTQNYTVQGLSFNTEVHFAVRTVDAAGNTSGVSNSPSVATPAGPVAVFDPDTTSAEVIVGDSTAETVTLQNTGSVDLQLTFDEDQLPEYLSVSPDSGSVSAGDSLDIEFTFNATDLNTGTFEATAEATLSGSGETALVSVATVLEVTTAPFPFAVDADPIDVSLENLPGEAAEEVTRTVTVTNESNEPQTLGVFGGAASSDTGPGPTTPLFSGEKLQEWKRFKKKMLRSNDTGSDQLTRELPQETSSRPSSNPFPTDLQPSDVEIPNAKFSTLTTGIGPGPLGGETLAEIPVNDPPTATAIGPSPFISAGNFAYREDETFFAIDDDTFDFLEVNSETGETTRLGTADPQSSDEIWTEIAVDPTDGTPYASTVIIGGASKIYTIEPPENPSGSVETEFITEIDGTILATAIDGEGQMYGVDFPQNRLVRIDKQTGAVDPVGPIGFTLDNLVFKGLDFDLKTGNLYLVSRVATFVGDLPFLFQVDPTTGEGTVLGVPGPVPGFFPPQTVFTYLANPSLGFVEPSPAQVTLSPGASIDVDLTISAERLEEGTYESDVVFGSEVAGEPSEEVGVALNVDGESKLNLAPAGDDAALEYDTTFTQDTTFTDQPVTIRNTGTADLNASISTGDQFTATQDTVSLFPGEAATFDVSFTPTQTGDFSQTLTVSSGDSTDTITLEGVALPRPVAELSQSEFDVQMYPGQEYTRTLTMENTGGDASDPENTSLEFVGMEENVITPEAIAPPAVDENFEDGVPPEGWQAVDEPGEGVEWKTNEEWGVGNWTGDGLSAHVDSDQNRNTPYDARLISPEKTFDENTALVFSLVFDQLGQSTFDVDISTDGGSTWETVRNFEEDIGDDKEGGGELVAISNEDMADFVDLGDTFQVRFRFWSPEPAPWDWYAQIDDVSFAEPTEFFAFEPTSGEIAPGESEDLTLSFDATNLASGTYEVDMVFETNDPAGDDGDGTITVPVTIDVIENVTMTMDTGEDRNPNEEFTMDFNVESLDDLAVSSYDMTMNFPADSMQIQDVVTEGTLSEGVTLSSNIDNENGTLTVSAFDPNTNSSESSSGDISILDIEGQGTLISADVKVAPESGNPKLGPVEMNFGEMVFNEGNPPVATEDHTLEIAPLFGDADINLSINVADALSVLDFSAGNEVFSETQKIQGDVSGNGDVSAFDASLIVQKTVGAISCFPAVDGCEDGNNLLASQSSSTSGEMDASLSWGEVSQPKQAIGSESSTLKLPLILEQTEQGIYSLDVSTELDPDVVSVEDVEAQLPDSWRSAHHTSDDGTLEIAMAGPSSLTETGKVATLTLSREDSEAATEVGGSVAVNEKASSELSAKSLANIPEEFALEGAYPNPFRQAGTLKMDLPKKADVTVEIYDLLGRKVKTAHDGEISAGTGRTVRINGADLSSGTYFYRARVEMSDDRQVKTGKMTVVK